MDDFEVFERLVGEVFEETGEEFFLVKGGYDDGEIGIVFHN